jgi:hypothetical protein
MTSARLDKGPTVAANREPAACRHPPAAGKRDRIFERTLPAAISHLRPVATRPDIGGAFGLASPQAELSAPLNCAPRKDQNTGSDEARNKVAEPPTERDAKES